MASAPKAYSDDDVQQLLQQNHHLNIISDFAIALLAFSSTEDVLWHTSREVVGRMGFEDCVIYLWDADSELLIQRSAFGHKTIAPGAIFNPLKLKLGEGIVGRAAQTQKTVVINDLALDPSYVLDVQIAASELAVPIIHHNELLGVIDSEHEQKNFYDAERIKLLTTVASMLAIKLAKTKLLTQLENSIVQLEYAEKLQKTLFQIAALSYDHTDGNGIYEKLHGLISALIYAKSFFLATYTEHADRVEYPYFFDEVDGLGETSRSDDEKHLDSIAAYVIFNNAAQLLSHDDIIQGAALGHYRIYGAIPQSWLGVPIDTGETLKAALVVQSYNKAICYSEKDRELLTFVSQHICDLLKRKVLDKKLQHQALHCALTGLANRLLLTDRINHAQLRMERKDSRICAILYMDIDLFKGINDRFGHGVGDTLLIEFSAILRRIARSGDTIARLGGDEFVIFLEDLDDETTALTLAQRIISALEQPLMVLDQVISISTSIGIAYLDDPELSAQEGLRRADTAMYQAKAAGRSNVQIYNQCFDLEKVRDVELGQDINNALANNEFELYYQPIIDVKTLKAVGFEALLRWQHPVKGWISPVDFIAYAEKSKLIEKIDRYVMSAALNQMQQWREQDGLQPRVSINISGRHFSSAQFIEFAMQLIKQTQVPAFSLGIEITERAVIDNIELALNNIRLLRANQVRVLLDDFGTGYSSLSYLHQLTLDTLKIDRSFVSGIRGEVSDNPIINSIVALAAALNLNVVAEGVETEQEFALLRQMNCEYCQGYMFAKPLPAAAALEYFRRHQ